MNGRLPAGRITLLFTDIEGSTRLLHDLEDDYPRLLGAHHEAVRAALDAHGGLEIRTQGDSFFAVFLEARPAVAAAVDAQRSLAALGLRVRMGIHTGDVIVAADDYVGMDVHRAARISSAAHGGQLVLSDETAAAIRGNGGPQLRDLGWHVLKDLPAPELLWQVVIDGLPGDFPPLRVHERPAAAAQLPDYSQPPADVPCPYVGLAAFGAAERRRYFGREDLVAEGLDRLGRHPLLVLVGASGSGKSSLLAAGILPELTEARAGGSVAWFTPGDAPLQRLAEAGSASLVAVDQLEELFTLCDDEAERFEFLDALLGLPSDEVTVVLSLRADFYAPASRHPGLAAALQDYQLLVGPMRDEELRRAIELPARHAGLALDPGIVPTIIRDVSGQPGALPLVSHALVETWKRRSDRLLNLIGYMQAGGVQGALAQTAEAAFEALTPAGQQIARLLFLRLAALGEGTEDTRRRVRREELRLREHDDRAVQGVIDALAAARLVTLGEAGIEVAHEALIRHWPRLRTWLQEDREGHRLHRRLTEAAQEWTTFGRDPGSLYRGVRLAAANEWAVSRGSELNELEREFLIASGVAEAADLDDVRRRNRRLRRLTVLLGVIGVVAALSAAVAGRETRRARAQERLAESRAIAGESAAALRDRLDRALLLGLDAYERARTPEARQALLAAIQRTRGVDAVLGGEHDIATSVAATPDGRTLASGGADGAVVLWDVRTRRVVARARLDGAVRSLCFDPRGAGLLAGSETGRIAVLAPRSLKTIRTLEGHLGAVTAIAVGSGGAVTSASSFDATIRRWNGTDEDDAARVERIDVAAGGVIAISRDGRRIAYAMRRGTVRLTGTREPLRWTSRAPTAIAFTDDGRLVVGDAGGRVAIGPASAAKPSMTRRVARGAVMAVSYGPEDDLVAASGPDGALTYVAAGDGVVRQRHPGHTSRVIAASRLPDGRLATAGRDGAVLVWPRSGDGPLEHATPAPAGAQSLSVSPDGTVAALGLTDGSVVLQRIRDGRAIGAPLGGVGGAVHAAFSPDGRRLAVADRTNAVRIWDVATRRPVGAPLRGFSEDYFGVAFREDGRSLVAWSDDGTMGTWALGTAPRSGPTLSAVGGRINEAAFSPDGRAVVAVTAGGSLERFATRSGKPLGAPLRSRAASLSALALGADGATALTGSESGEVQLWDLRRRTAGATFGDGGAAITDLALHPGGRLLAVTDSDALSFWSTAPPRRLGAQLVPTAALVAAQFTHGGGRLVTLGGRRLTVWHPALWSGDGRVLRARVCAVVAGSPC
jgi:WD40 repeat protein/class 3 adenylate cyclase